MKLFMIRPSTQRDLEQKRSKNSGLSCSQLARSPVLANMSKVSTISCTFLQKIIIFGNLVSKRMIENGPYLSRPFFSALHYFFLNNRLTEVLRPDDSALASPAAELTMIIPLGTVMNSRIEWLGTTLQPK